MKQSLKFIYLTLSAISLVLCLNGSLLASQLFFEVENQRIEILNGYTRDPQTGEFIEVYIPVTWVLWNFGQSGKALQAFEGSAIRSSAYDRGIAEVDIAHPIPAGTYDIWYRLTETGREWENGNLRYAWLEWPEGKTDKKDLTSFLSMMPLRVFNEWIKIGDGVQLPDLKSYELSCILEVRDTFSNDSLDYSKGKYRSVGWDAICLSKDPNFIPPAVVPVGGWEKRIQLLPGERIPLDEKKIITLGGGGGIGGCPSPEHIRDNIRDMEESLPVNGVVISGRVPSNGGFKSLHNSLFTSEVISWNVCDEHVSICKDISFNNFTDNFIRLNVVPGLSEDIDWFNDEVWEVIADKWRLTSTIAKEGNLKGIFLDTEQYKGDHNGTPFKYSAQVHSREKTFEEYRQEVRKRGRQLMEAIQDIYPDITIIFTYATAEGIRSPQSLGLLPAFIDGMLEGGPDATFIDGYEGAYLYERYQEFVDAYRFIKEEGATLSLIPDIYRERIKVGFGLWTEKFTREELTYALHYALRVSDGYVWLYLSSVRAWSPTTQIKAICQDISWAIEESRKEHPLDKN